MDNEEIKIRNIIEMGLTFSTMSRVFEKGSKEKIIPKLEDTLGDFSHLNTEENYQDLHERFCKWLTKEIKTAKGENENASWGHAAKVIDVVLKVYIYYCKLPSSEESKKIVPWLNAAIDTKILKHLKRQNKKSKISGVENLKQIDRKQYEILQKMIQEDINQNRKMYPVQWDDRKWRELNNKSL